MVIHCEGAYQSVQAANASGEERSCHTSDDLLYLMFLVCNCEVVRQLWLALAQFFLVR